MPAPLPSKGLFAAGIRTKWTQDMDKALLTLSNMTSEKKAVIMNKRFGTKFTRNAIVGRIHRLKNEGSNCLAGKVR